MKIKYTKKRLRANLFVGLLWLTISILKWIFNDYVNWMDGFFLAMALLYLGQYFYEWRNQYLKITKDQIAVNYPFGKKINMSEIYWIKKFAGDYILKTDKKELTINTQIIDKDSLKNLNEILAKIDLPVDRTPFASRG
ncbi:MAG: hypothetical protein KJO16_05975 [Muriicola sp.]|nr:hypothetical protein [Muriicola sp.]MBT8282505.1 hypothetical protein [Muriicola sp.]NNK11524.1 hypothetical protein [Flavobacteriaceae bacterium]